SATKSGGSGNPSPPYPSASSNPRATPSKPRSPSYMTLPYNLPRLLMRNLPRQELTARFYSTNNGRVLCSNDKFGLEVILQRIPPFRALDALRGFAAAWVVMVHCC